MKNRHWQLWLSLFLIILSVLLYFLHFLIFRDAHHIFIYLLGDIAYIPVEVLIVTLIIHRLLVSREKRSMLKKLNMVVGAFFSEVGIKLIKDFSVLDPNVQKIRESLSLNSSLTDNKFKQLRNFLKEYEYLVTVDSDSLEKLKEFLVGKRDFLLRLLENPNLLEHERFSELLWAVFHFTEELSGRSSFYELPDKDYEHLAGDIKRVYKAITLEWVEYMRHLNSDYPYLFSLAMRTSPFNLSASVIIK